MYTVNCYTGSVKKYLFVSFREPYMQEEMICYSWADFFFFQSPNWARGSVSFGKTRDKTESTNWFLDCEGS